MHAYIRAMTVQGLVQWKRIYSVYSESRQKRKNKFPETGSQPHIGPGTCDYLLGSLFIRGQQLYLPGGV